LSGREYLAGMDVKSRVQAVERTPPLLPIDFTTTEKRTHDYVSKI
jgi:hypothetical protein